MDTDHGKVHQEVDSIVGQQQEKEEPDGINYMVTVCHREVHYVRAMHDAAAIMLALNRAPDWEGMEVYVEDDDEPGAAHMAGWCSRRFN